MWTIAIVFYEVIVDYPNYELVYDNDMNGISQEGYEGNTVDKEGCKGSYVDKEGCEGCRKRGWICIEE